MEKMNNNNGYSLIELLVAMGIAVIVSAAIFVTHQVQAQGKITQEVTLEMQQAGRAAISMMNRDLRMAGCDPNGNSGAGFAIAAAGEVVFTMDFRGDPASTRPFEPNGSVEDPSERVRYVLTGTQNLGRATGAADVNGRPTGIPQPLARNIDALNFVYLDAAGNVTADLDAIRSVQISLVIRSAAIRDRGMLRAHTDTNVYQNLQGDTIFTPTGAQRNFRRIQFNTEVHCRNMGDET
jgi:type IV pilus assembly protein PilW